MLALFDVGAHSLGQFGMGSSRATGRYRPVLQDLGRLFPLKIAADSQAASRGSLAFEQCGDAFAELRHSLPALVADQGF
jgi:hypothetical protein